MTLSTEALQAFEDNWISLSEFQLLELFPLRRRHGIGEMEFWIVMPSRRNWTKHFRVHRKHEELSNQEWIENGFVD